MSPIHSTSSWLVVPPILLLLLLLTDFSPWGLAALVKPASEDKGWGLADAAKTGIKDTCENVKDYVVEIRREVREGKAKGGFRVM